jgi:hypothetical protein
MRLSAPKKKRWPWQLPQIWNSPVRAVNTPFEIPESTRDRRSSPEIKNSPMWTIIVADDRQPLLLLVQQHDTAIMTGLERKILTFTTAFNNTKLNKTECLVYVLYHWNYLAPLSRSNRYCLMKNNELLSLTFEQTKLVCYKGEYASMKSIECRTRKPVNISYMANAKPRRISN